MPEFATYDLLERIGRTLEGPKILREAASPHNKTVFLSHSSKDNALVPVVATILERNGGRVYVDLADDALPQVVSGVTAERLRGAVRCCPRFVLLVSTNSRDSIWIPWELGLADGGKGERSVALFPVASIESEQTWATQEYLGLYQRIVWGTIRGMEKAGWLVHDHAANTAERLVEWLQ